MFKWMHKSFARLKSRNMYLNNYMDRCNILYRQSTLLQRGIALGCVSFVTAMFFRSYTVWAIFVLYVISAACAVLVSLNVTDSTRPYNSFLIKDAVQSVYGAITTFIYGNNSQVTDKVKNTPHLNQKSKIVDCGTLINDELERILNLVMRDFIQSWYKNLSNDPQVIEEINEILYKIINTFSKTRVETLDMNRLVEEILNIFQEHLAMVQVSMTSFQNQPRRLSRLRTFSKRVNCVEQSFTSKFILHSALDDELAYTRHILNVITDLLIKELQGCKAAKTVIADILSRNILKEIIDLLSDNECLNELFIVVFSNETILERSNRLLERCDSKTDKNASVIQNQCLCSCLDNAQSKLYSRDSELVYTNAEGTSNIFVTDTSLPYIVNDSDFVTPCYSENCINSINPSINDSDLCDNDYPCSHPHEDTTDYARSTSTNSDFVNIPSTQQPQDVHNSESLSSRPRRHSACLSGHLSKSWEHILRRDMSINNVDACGSNDTGLSVCVDRLREALSENDLCQLESGVNGHKNSNLVEIGCEILEFTRQDVDNLDNTLVQALEPSCEQDNNERHNLSMTCNNSAHDVCGLTGVQKQLGDGVTTRANNDCYIIDDAQSENLNHRPSEITGTPGDAHKEACPPSQVETTQLLTRIRAAASRGKSNKSQKSEAVYHAQKTLDEKDLPASIPYSKLLDQQFVVSSDEDNDSVQSDDYQGSINNGNGHFTSTDTTSYNKFKFFQDCSIPSTEMAREFNNSTMYTLYVLKFSAWYLGEQQGLVLRDGQVKRRFREFINLHSRLDDEPQYKRSIKGVKGPRRWMNFPFGNLEKDNVEGRRVFLENFVRSLLSKEDICNGSEMREFLGYEGSGNIAFVRKSMEISVPRIDKMFVKTVQDVFGKIGTALPKLPPDVLPAILPSLSKSTSNDGFLDADDVDMEFGILHLEQAGELDGILSSYIKQLTAHQDGLSPLYATSDWQTHILSQQHADDVVDGGLSDQGGEALTLSDELPLSSAVLNLSVQALLPQGDVWVCRERVVDAIKIVVGKPLEKFLEDTIADLSSGQSCSHYLEILREKLWPGGHLLQSDPYTKTDSQKRATRLLAKNAFIEFLPAPLPKIIGRSVLEFGVDQILDSLSYQQLNRHLAYNLLDLIVTRLFPELSGQEMTSRPTPPRTINTLSSSPS